MTAATNLVLDRRGAKEKAAGGRADIGDLLEDGPDGGAEWRFSITCNARTAARATVLRRVRAELHPPPVPVIPYRSCRIGYRRAFS